MEPQYDPDEAEWAALARAMERNVGKLLARFETQFLQASEELADEIQAYLAKQEGEK